MVSGITKPRLAVLLSGGGTTLQNLLDRIADGRFAARIAVVLSSKTEAGGLERARRAGVPAVAVPRRAYADVASFNDALHAELDRHEFDLVVMAGFLSPFELRGRYEQRVLNIHPSLLPAFGGQGFYGARVHRAVLDAGVKVTGCTVHLADDSYDRGPILAQTVVEVRDDDTPETLASRVHAAENETYPEAIRAWAAGECEVVGRRVLRRRD